MTGHMTRLFQTSGQRVEHLHSLADGLGETVHNVAHHAEVRHIVDVSLLRGGGDGPQLALVSVLHTWDTHTHTEGQEVVTCNKLLMIQLAEGLRSLT